MNPQLNSAKDFFLNLGATVSLYTVVGSLISLLFTVINYAYPKVTEYYYASTSIAFPVSLLIISAPILILIMWVLGKQYTTGNVSTIHKWLSYLTLFIAGIIVAGDLVYVIYNFISGEDIGKAFLLKALVLLVVSGSIFGYYLSDILGKLTPKSRLAWRIFTLVLIIGSIILGFAVLGSPRTQRLYKYDNQKVNDLMMLSSSIQSYYYNKGALPKDFSELSTQEYYINSVDSQTQKPYEYNIKTATTFELCAEFNKDSNEKLGARDSSMAYPYGGTSWTHPAGRHCFEQKVDLRGYPTKI